MVARAGLNVGHRVSGETILHGIVGGKRGVVQAASLDNFASRAQHTPMRLAILNALLLAGCAPTQVVIPKPLPINSIIYTAGPLDTHHPVYVVMLNDIAPSLFRGEKNTTFVGSREIGRVEEYAAAAAYISELL